MKIIEKRVSEHSDKVEELQLELREWEVFNNRKNDELRDEISSLEKLIKTLKNLS